MLIFYLTKSVHNQFSPRLHKLTYQNESNYFLKQKIV